MAFFWALVSGFIIGILTMIGVLSVYEHLRDKHETKVKAKAKQEAIDLDGIHRAFDHNLRNITFDEEVAL